MSIVIDGQPYAVAAGLEVTVEGSGPEVRVYGWLDGYPSATHVAGDDPSTAREVHDAVSLPEALKRGWLSAVDRTGDWPVDDL